MPSIHALSVFCASSLGNDEGLIQSARDTGRLLAEKGIHIVYGGAKVGLMGELADAALACGGQVTGIIPKRLMKKEIAHEGLTELIVVETMSERKKRMDEFSDGAMVLPGGYGTLDEMFEMLTWAQLGLHTKPVGLLNTAGFYTTLLACIDGMAEKGMLRASNRQLLVHSEHPEELLQLMMSYEGPVGPGWITDKER